MSEIDSNESARADAYFREQVGVGLGELLGAIPGDAPEGVPVTEDSDRYRRIRHARQDEDPTLPLGAWERELKRADWNAAAKLSTRGLVDSSKDLQLAVWLFEASIARSGFQAVGPCLTLIDGLFARYGERLHPQDPEHRINLIVWVGQKLLAPLRRATITATGSEHEFAWIDWEHAQRNEQVRASLGRQRESELEGASLEQVGAALASTQQERIVFLLGVFADALSALQRLERTLDAQFGEDAPSLGAMRDLLERIEVELVSETRRRGLHLPAAEPSESERRSEDAAPVGEPAEASDGSHDRREVYAALAHIAQVLERIEPHSPVPYLIRRAVAWGGLNTAQLYNEVFVRCGGQINIFELLGLNDPVAGHERSASG